MGGTSTIIKALLANVDTDELVGQLKPVADGFLTELRTIIREENTELLQQVQRLIAEAKISGKYSE